MYIIHIYLDKPNYVCLPLLLVVEDAEEGAELGVGEPQVLGNTVAATHRRVQGKKYKVKKGQKRT